MKKPETLLTHFWVITYIDSAFKFYEEKRNLLVYIWAITNITSEFDFYKKKTET